MYYFLCCKLRQKRKLQYLNISSHSISVKSKMFGLLSSSQLSSNVMSTNTKLRSSSSLLLFEESLLSLYDITVTTLVKHFLKPEQMHSKYFFISKGENSNIINDKHDRSTFVPPPSLFVLLPYSITSCSLFIYELLVVFLGTLILIA